MTTPCVEELNLPAKRCHVKSIDYTSRHPFLDGNGDHSPLGITT
jgi:hypothetical protein